MVLTFGILAGLGGCGGDSSTSEDLQVNQAEAGGSDPTDPPEANSSADGDELDPDSVNPCVLEPAEVKLLHDLNSEPLGALDDATYGPGVVADSSSYATCDYEVLFPEDDGMPATYFSLGVDARPSTTCFVEHRGLCVFPATTYGEVEPTAYVVPESITAAVKARLDAQ